MKAVFVELPAFSRHRAIYLDEGAFAELQTLLMINPLAGPVIPGTCGLRKLRLQDVGRHKGRRGGIRVIYFWWEAGRQFWLFTLYDKSEMTDLSSQQKNVLKDLIKNELDQRQKE